MTVQVRGTLFTESTGINIENKGMGELTILAKLETESRIKCNIPYFQLTHKYYVPREK